MPFLAGRHDWYSKEVPTLLPGAIFFGLKHETPGLWKSLVDKKYAADVGRVPVWLRPHGKRGYTLLHMAVALHSERLVEEVLRLGYPMGGVQMQMKMCRVKATDGTNPKKLAEKYASEKFAATSQGNPGGKEVSPAEFDQVLASIKQFF